MTAHVHLPLLGIHHGASHAVRHFHQNCLTPWDIYLRRIPQYHHSKRLNITDRILSSPSTSRTHRCSHEIIAGLTKDSVLLHCSSQSRIHTARAISSLHIDIYPLRCKKVSTTSSAQSDNSSFCLIFRTLLLSRRIFVINDFVVSCTAETEMLLIGLHCILTLYCLLTYVKISKSDKHTSMKGDAQVGQRLRYMSTPPSCCKAVIARRAINSCAGEVLYSLLDKSFPPVSISHGR